MQPDYWLRQTVDKPLFPDLLWSRPENRAHAGKLLIVGGNAQGFAVPAEAFAEANKAGIGTVRVLLPDSLQKSIGRVFAAGEYAPSTPSGSFSQLALSELISLSQWADGVLFPGELGRNSETAIMLEHFLDKSDAAATLTKDAADMICQQPLLALQRSKTLLVLSFGQLQRLGSNARFGRAFTSDMDFLKLLDALYEFTKRFAPFVVTKFHEQLVAAVNGQISTTKLTSDIPIWRLGTATHAVTWWLQNPSKPFEALTTACHTISASQKPK